MIEKNEELTTTIHEPEIENCECPYCYYTKREYKQRVTRKKSQGIRKTTIPFLLCD